MHTEIDFQNADGRLLPGMYVEAMFPSREKANVLTVPLEAVDTSEQGNEGTVLWSIQATCWKSAKSFGIAGKHANRSHFPD